MSKQDIIDTINNEFTGKAIQHSEQCEYLTDDGRKCVIGLFIPDGHEAQRSTGDVECILGTYPELSDYMPSKSIRFLDSLQREHDSIPTILDAEGQREILTKWVDEHYDEFHKGER